MVATAGVVCYRRAARRQAHVVWEPRDRQVRSASRPLSGLEGGAVPAVTPQLRRYLHIVGGTLVAPPTAPAVLPPS